MQKKEAYNGDIYKYLQKNDDQRKKLTIIHKYSIYKYKAFK